MSQSTPQDNQPKHQMTQPATMANDNSAKSSQINPTVYRVSNAAGQCTKDAKAAAKSIVVKPVDKLPTENGDASGNNAASRFIETQQPAVTGHWYDRNGRDRKCDHCNVTYKAKRSSSRFCSGRCRLKAHKVKHGVGNE